jgi:hypothetical protein
VSRSTLGSVRPNEPEAWVRYWKAGMVIAPLIAVYAIATQQWRLLGVALLVFSVARRDGWVLARQGHGQAARGLVVLSEPEHG